MAYVRLTGQQATALEIPRKWLLGIVCLCSGIAPLAARWIPGDVARLSYGLLVAAIFLAFTLLARRQPALQRFWELSFAFFVLAFVQVLNNSIPAYFGLYVLHEVPAGGNPLASTVPGTVVIQLLETLIAIVPVIVLTKVSGQNLGSIYARKGNIGRGLLLALLVFVAFYALAATGHTQRLLPTNGSVTVGRFLALSPALVLLVISNGVQEEFLFRGLFLQKYSAFFGARISNVLQAAVFAVAHVGVTYTPIALLFIVVFVFPLGLIAGYLMRSTNGMTAPVIFHAGADIPIYLAFLSFAV